MTLPLRNGAASPEALQNGIGAHANQSVVESDLLIVGTGPAGASLACFLTSYGALDDPEPVVLTTLTTL